MGHLAKWLFGTVLICIAAYEYKGERLDSDEIDTLTIVSSIIRKLV